MTGVVARDIRQERLGIGRLGAGKLKQLRRLLEHLISGLGTFP